MRPFRYTLVGDGSSDRCLVPIIDWLLSSIPSINDGGVVAQPAADYRQIPFTGPDLESRVRQAHRYLPCDILFVHRDAEQPELAGRRWEEIHAATAELRTLNVPIVPVRMTEAWLLIEEAAIRLAADNPHGTVEIPLPPPAKLELESDPKDLLYRCLMIASEKRGRRLQRFRPTVPRRVHLVAERIADFSRLRQLAAFNRFEAATRQAVASLLA